MIKAQLENPEIRGLIMIILNGIFNFFLKLPHLFSMFFILIDFVITDDNFQNFNVKYCIGFRICTVSFIILNFLFILSLNLNFFVFINFDKKFHVSFQITFARCAKFLRLH